MSYKQPLVIKRNNYYVISLKDQPYKSILLQGIYIMRPHTLEDSQEGALRDSVDCKYLVRDATETEIILYAKPLVDKM